MKVEIFNNGDTATIKTVDVIRGPHRWRLRIDIKEKYVCRSGSIYHGSDNIGVQFIEDSDTPPTEVCFLPENEEETKVINTWLTLPDIGKYEYRMWLVETFPSTAEREILPQEHQKVRRF